MQAFLAILRYDLDQLARSWLVRSWVALLAIPALFLVVVAANEEELASETLAAYTAAVYAPFSAIAVGVLAVGAVSSETNIIVDSILSKSVTRTEYIAAKIAARLGVTLAIYLIIMVPFTYLIMRYAVADASLFGVVTGLLMVAALLTFLATLGIALSTMIQNVLFAVLLLVAGVLMSGVVLQFMGLSWMSTTAVINDLPRTFRGETPAWDEVRVLIVFGSLSIAAVLASIWHFRQKDL
jgi:ABC-2 type transport system permease protein